MDLAQIFGLAVIDTRDGDSNPCLEDGETITQTFDDVQLVLGSNTDQGSGKLFIAEGRIIWLSRTDQSFGYAAEFSAISMHAVATDPETVDKPCLYVQMDVEEAELDDEDDEAEASPFPELRFIPADPSTLDAIFQAFCEGAERNPDADAEEEGQGSLFFDQGEVLAGAFDAAEIAEDVDELVGDDPDRFGDAEDDGNGAEEMNGNAN